MYGIADLDNCYCSCEKVFRPDLEGKPIVVLSNNDGCVVARSNEAKAMGIKEGTPYFQLAQQFPNAKIAVFSSNYELYGELTGRVVSIISKETPAYFRYSIDECFMYLDGIELDKLQQWGERLHRRVKREVGMPISIGLAPNKTLAKIASKLAKKFEVYKHCCMIDTDYKTGEGAGMVSHRGCLGHRQTLCCKTTVIRLQDRPRLCPASQGLGTTDVQ